MADLDHRRDVATMGTGGKELYYVEQDGTLMAASIAVNGATIEPGRPAPLFTRGSWVAHGS